MAMLRELEEHHDEKSVEWSTIDPMELVAQAQSRLTRIRYGWVGIDPKQQLVHAANELTIAWAILSSRGEAT